MTEKDKVIEAINIKKYFPVRARERKTSEQSVLKAVDGLSFQIGRAETLGLAGESGCGKTTTAKLLLSLYPLTEGKILCNGTDISALKGKELKNFRLQAQMVFQDPYESLNPRFKVKSILEEPLEIHRLGDKNERLDKILEVLEEVGLNPANRYLESYPHELSGGQRQRVAIARALILRPSFLVTDEPVSMLDVSIRAGVLNLLQRMIDERALAGLCISHDLSLLRYLCHRSAIMYLGRIVEIGPTEALIKKRYHPYTVALLEAVPHPNPDYKYRLDNITGEVTSAANLPSGCRFYNRCVKKMEICREIAPQPVEIEKGHWVECHLYNN